MQLSIPFTAYIAALGPLHADLLAQGYVPERPSVAVLNDADDKRKGQSPWWISAIQDRAAAPLAIGQWQKFGRRL